MVAIPLTYHDSEDRVRKLAYLGLLVATLGWGGAFIAGKLALREFSPMSASAWRYLLAGSVLVPFALRHARTYSLRPVAGPLTLMIVCGGFFYPLFFMLSLERTSATNTSLIVALMPVITYSLCPLVGEEVSGRRWIAVLIALVGAVVVITRADLGVLVDVTRLNTGDLIALCAACVWAVFNLASRRTVVALPASLINVTVFGCGGVAMMVAAAPDTAVASLIAASPGSRAAVFYLAIFSSVLSGQLYLNAMRVLGVSRTVIFIYCVPFVTAILAAFILGESISVYQAVGGGLIFGGLVLAAR